MKVAVEHAPQQSVMYSIEVPGIAVCGDTRNLAVAMREEILRFAACFPWLAVPSAQVCVVAERVETPSLPEPELGGALLASDLQRTAGELMTLLRLLKESAQLLRRCHASLPDAAYNYMNGAEHPAWQPASGDEALEWYLRRLRTAMALWNVEIPDADWYEGLCSALDQLSERSEFRQNRLFHTPEGFCCAGSWLRGLVEQCHLAGRRMYNLGIEAFGRKVIENPFHFSA